MTWVAASVDYEEDGSSVIDSAHDQGLDILLTAWGPSYEVAQPDLEDRGSTWMAGLPADGADAIEVWRCPGC